MINTISSTQASGKSCLIWGVPYIGIDITLLTNYLTVRVKPIIVIPGCHLVIIIGRFYQLDKIPGGYF